MGTLNDFDKEIYYARYDLGTGNIESAINQLGDCSYKIRDYYIEKNMFEEAYSYCEVGDCSGDDDWYNLVFELVKLNLVSLF